jgi:hypothetical protein
MSDERYGDLAAAFNFTSQGSIGSAPVAQTTTDMNIVLVAYVKNPPSNAASKAAVGQAVTYYQENIQTLTSVSAFLADNKLTTVALQAFGLNNPPPSKDVLQKVLESNLSDPKSYANSLGDKRYVQFATAFNFGSDGNLVRQPPQQPMSRQGLQGIATAFDRQTLEDRAGNASPGVQLALYFQRHASSIVNAYDILADKSLLKVVQTALSIPANASKQSIDSQARTINQKMKFADLQDPKKLTRFISRFAALYDLKNPSSNGATSVLTLLGVPAPVQTSASLGGTPNVLTLFGK